MIVITYELDTPPKEGGKARCLYRLVYTFEDDGSLFNIQKEKFSINDDEWILMRGIIAPPFYKHVIPDCVKEKVKSIVVDEGLYDEEYVRKVQSTGSIVSCFRK